jgi:RimJ/RimL family protein N-acetyltransferase
MLELLKTADIALRPTDEEDMETVLNLEREDDNADFIRQWSIEKHKQAIRDPNLAHLIVETIRDHQIIGCIILVGLEDPDNSIEFKRIVIARKGKGYGRQAVQLVKKYTFEQCRCHRLWLEVMEHNTRAFGLYESEGFTLEGVHREAVKRGGCYLSLQVMSILADEYRSDAG